MADRRVTVACIIIAGPGREQLMDEQVIPSVRRAGFDEIVVVGSEHHSGDGYRHIPVQPIWGSTLDALVKRDVGALVTTSDWLVYLSNDHAVDSGFVSAFVDSALANGFNERMVGVPVRYTVRNDEAYQLNMGLPYYCGGHAGIYHRTLVQQVPWMLAPYHRCWDLYYSRMLVNLGYELVELPECRIEDVDDRPGVEPWR